MERTETDISDHLANQPDEWRDDMIRLDRIVREELDDPEVVLFVGKFWGGTDQEIVGYAPFTYERTGGVAVDWFVVGMARQKHYLSLYVSAVEDGAYLSEKYGKDLGRVKVGKSSISFASLDDVDLDKLRTLLQKAQELGPTR